MSSAQTAPRNRQWLPSPETPRRMWKSGTRGETSGNCGTVGEEFLGIAWGPRLCLCSALKKKKRG